LGKLHHAAQVFGLKTTGKFLCQLIAHALDKLVAILGAVSTAQHLGVQTLAHAPIQPRQLRIHRARQPLAASGNQIAQFGMQADGRIGRHPALHLGHVRAPMSRLSAKRSSPVEPNADLPIDRVSVAIPDELVVGASGL